MTRTSLLVPVALILATAAVGAQTPASSSSTSPSGRYVAIGCLSKQGTGAAARYLVTDPRGEKPTTYRVQGDAEQLARHVGHTVEVAGALTPPASASGQYLLKMNTIGWIASSCSASSIRSGVRP